MNARTTLALLILGLALAVTGCKNAGTSAAGTSYNIKFGSNELEGRVTYDHFTVHEIARDVVEKDFLYTITLERVDGRVGVIQATTAKDKKVKVESQREGEKLTLVLIHISGDQAAEVDMLNRIEAKLESAGGSGGAGGAGGAGGEPGK